MADWRLSENAAKLAAFGASAASPYTTMLGQVATGQVPTAATVTAGTPTSSSIPITWTGASASADAPVQGYEVWIQQGLDAPKNVQSVSSITRSYTYSGLQSGTSYTVWVVAYNKWGTGPASNKPTRTTSGGTVPTAPGQPSASSITQTSVTLTWGASTTPADAPVLEYLIHGGPTVVSAGTALSKTVTLLSAGTTYSFTVRARNVNGTGPASPATTATTTGAPTTGSIVVYAAGDVAHATYLADSKRTGALINGKTDKNVVLALGDLAYSAGSITNYTQYYDPNWGMFKALTEPAPGNHEYKTVNAGGYRQYWGTRVVNSSGLLYRAFIKGSWLFLQMDSGDAQSTLATSGIEEAQVTWAQQQITANQGKFTGILAYWHHPRFSSGNDGNNLDTASMVNMLRKNNADIVLCGHDHNYERFHKLNAAGTAIDSGGIRHFTVGTGGGSLRGASTKKFGSVCYWGSGGDWTKGRRQGVLRLELTASNYKWQWLDASSPAGPETDSGIEPVNPK